MSRRKRKRVAAFLISDSKVVAGFSPLASMRRDAFSTGAKLCKQMCQFMKKRALDLFRAMLMQQRV